MMGETVENAKRVAKVLLVEDNPGDITLTKLAFEQARIMCVMDVVMTGEEALEYLQKQGDYTDVETPDIVLLDLNLPGIHGQQVLEYIKNTEPLKRTPVVILSSSRAESDVVQSYDRHANGYVVKPLNLQSFYDVVQKLENFWFSLVILPK